MKTYKVTWEIEVDAETALDAAREAESIMHDYAIDGHRPVFVVASSYEGPRPPATIDLEREQNT